MGGASGGLKARKIKTLPPVPLPFQGRGNIKVKKSPLKGGISGGFISQTKSDIIFKIDFKERKI